MTDEVMQPDPIDLKLKLVERDIGSLSETEKKLARQLLKNGMSVAQVIDRIKRDRNPPPPTPSP